MAHLLSRIGGFSARHRWLVVGVWLVLLVIAVGGAAKFSQPTDSTFTISGLNSLTTLDRIDTEFASAGTAEGSGKIVFAAPEGETLTGSDQATISALAASLRSVDGITSATDPFDPATKTLSADGRIGYVPITLATATITASTEASIAQLMTTASSPTLQLAATSTLAVDAGVSSSGQLVGIIIAFVVLVVTFGSLLAAGLPLITALIGLGVGVGGIYASTAFISLSSVAPSLAILIALAVGIDYALFIINRHRRNLLEGMAVRDSIALTMGTAGSAVFFAALTVIIALAGLAVVNISFVTQMGLSAASAVLISLLVSLTLTPALLGIAGTRVLSGRARKRLATQSSKPRRQLAAGWVAMISKRPVPFAIASVVVLAVLAVPVLTMRLGLPNDGTDTAQSSDRQAFDLLAAGFGSGVNAPILVLADFPEATASAADVANLSKALASVPDVASVIPSGLHENSALITVIPASGPSDEATETLVRELRDGSVAGSLTSTPALLVSGSTAVALDISDRVAGALPLYLGLVAVFAFIILLLAFRSILVPLKATLSFFLSLGATLGCVVAVFQWGWLGGVFHVDPAGPLLSFLPIIIVGVLFGLSMDYEMFLVSAMRERHARGDAATPSVTVGYSHSAKVVVAAALIMIGIFGNGALTGSGTLQPIALGLAVGVLLDAFVVRLTLVPAVMVLFGKAAWWFPNWLDRVVPQMDIEGSSLQEEILGAEGEGEGEGERELVLSGRE